MMDTSRGCVPTFDRLTGLPNRTLFLSKLSNAISQSPSDVSVLSLKLHRMNHLMDRSGKALVDQLLGAAAGRIQHSLGSEDLLGRVGHHRFAILLTSPPREDRTDSICKTIQSSFETPFKLERHTINVALSIGISSADQNSQSAEQLLEEADAAANMSGTDRVSTAELKSGSHIGRFEVISLLGKGGMGEVYCAYDSILDREVAIKILSNRISHDPTAIKRFRTEIRAVAALSHPNILALHDIGNAGGRYYAVMERLKGETLRQKMRTDKIGHDQALDFAIQLSDGLTAAHERGVIHRDLKPENIFITNQNLIKILDFGLATFTVRKESITDDFQTVTLGSLTDQHCDIFSFGAVFYEMLCGERAFGGSNNVDILTAILKEEPKYLFSDKIQPQLRPLVSKCLRKTADDRYSSARELANALKHTMLWRSLDV
jgi:diguanylate cyclase (GGDEF)-like protein